MNKLADALNGSNGQERKPTSTIGIDLAEAASSDASRLVMILLGLCALRAKHGGIGRAHRTACIIRVDIGMRRWCWRATRSQALRQSLSWTRRETVRSRVATSGAVHDAGYGNTAKGKDIMDGKLDGSRSKGGVLFAALLGKSHLRPAAPARVLVTTTSAGSQTPSLVRSVNGGPGHTAFPQ
jgi:hypothetical protein